MDSARANQRAAASDLETAFTRHAGVDIPLICGPMYPCSNPELVGAVSKVGGLGVFQPISLTYVHGHEYRDGLRLMKELSGNRAIGMNALIEKSSRRYMDRMARWVDIALEEGVRFFITSLGNPRWVCEKAHSVGGVVYHDVTERKWAEKGLEGGVDGLIAVNNRAGGHAGPKTAADLYGELADFGVPLICAGGVGSEDRFVEALEIGYAGAQLGTRFIATTECSSAVPYKQAIVDAKEADVVLSERITGVPVSVIKTPYIERMGLKAGAFARWMLRGRRRKHWMRTIYALKSLWQLKRASLDEEGTKDFWQAGKSVAGVTAIEPAAKIVHRFAEAARETQAA
ncbi:MAG: NAD(P)H-dependent flavin oxidoreductase [Thermoanaerobaculia bacterium]